MDLITTTRAAEILGVDGSQVRRLIQAGKLSSHVINQRLQLLSRAEVEAYGKEHPRSKAGRPRRDTTTR